MNAEQQQQNTKLGNLQATTVKKKELIKIIEENQKKHDLIYNEAVKGYQIAVKEKLAQYLADAEAGKSVPSYLGIDAPVSYSDTYKGVIARLKLGISEVVTLNNNEFEQYVLNNFSWKEHFVSNSSAYLVSKTALENF